MFQSQTQTVLFMATDHIIDRSNPGRVQVHGDMQLALLNNGASIVSNIWWGAGPIVLSVNLTGETPEEWAARMSPILGEIWRIPMPEHRKPTRYGSEDIVAVFKVTEVQYLGVHSDGQISYGHRTPDGELNLNNAIVFISIDDHDGIGMGVTIQEVGVRFGDDYLVLAHFEKPKYFSSLREAYTQLYEFFEGFEVFELTEERVYGPPFIPGH